MKLDAKKGEKRASKRGTRKDMLKDERKDERKAQDRRVSTLPKECWRKGLTLRQFQN